MNKKMVAVAAAAIVLIGAVAAAKRHQPAAAKPTMWDKMRHHMEEMPEDFPPRIMFDNAEAARMNTERILDLLEGKPSSADDIEVLKSA